MAILTDLPNELLLKIIADVSPLYLEFFLLSCKRIYLLREDVTREYHLVKKHLDRRSPSDRLVEIFLDPGTALYPTSFTCSSSCKPHYRDDNFKVDLQEFKHFYTTCNGSFRPRQDIAVPLLLTLLLNLRKLNIVVGKSPYLTETVAQILESTYEPSTIAEEPSALGRLTEVNILGCWCSQPCIDQKDANHAMKLSSLLAMIPTVRKLKIWARNNSPYISPRPYHYGGVTEFHLRGALDSTFLEDLIDRTRSLEKFTYQHEISSVQFARANFAPWRVVQSIQQVAGDSLVYLSLILLPSGFVDSNDHLRRYRKDLFIGCLQGLVALKMLRTSVDLLIKTRRIGRNHFRTHAKTGTVQSLMSVLPLSLETLGLDKGLKKWDADTLERLFEDITDWKAPGTASLNLVNFANCLDFEELLSSETKAACQKAEVKLGYSTGCTPYDNDLAFESHRNWNERPWIEALKSHEKKRVKPFWA